MPENNISKLAYLRKTVFVMEIACAKFGFNLILITFSVFPSQSRRRSCWDILSRRCYVTEYVRFRDDIGIDLRLCNHHAMSDEDEIGLKCI